MKGGPALHHDDQNLILQNKIQLEHLVTIRRGEPVLSPLKDSLEYLQTEMIKINGQPNDWTCLFFDIKTVSCLIYENRPLECTLLKCWDINDLERIIKKDLICRADIFPDDNPVLDQIIMHEEECSLARLNLLLSSLGDKSLQDEIMDELTEIVQKDLAIRAQAIAAPNFPEKMELFIFGRPLFIILQNFGIIMHELGGTLVLRFTPAK
jgi:Fe-S-cluster containining protein